MTAFLSLLLLLLHPSLALALARPPMSLSARSTLPQGRLSTSGRWIIDESGVRVKLRCVNWAAHMETMIPEGLHRQPAFQLAQWIAQQGFNCVRLTYSTDMALASGTLISQTFPAAAAALDLPSADFTRMYTDVGKQNPALALSGATVLDAFTVVIGALSSNGLMVILDNHVSHATWCCSNTDGNGWFNSGKSTDPNTSNFDPDKWITGLENMANYAKGHANVIGLSLRNELRPSGNNVHRMQLQWNTMITKAGQAVHAANPNVLVIMGGINYDTDLSWLRWRPLDLSLFGNKAVMEYHIYPYAGWDGNCPALQYQIGEQAGFLLEQNNQYTAPLLVSEFGMTQDGAASQKDLDWLQCLRAYLESNDAEWAVWALQGSYYARSWGADVGDPWGLLDHDWTTWKNPGFFQSLGKMWDVTQGPGVAGGQSQISKRVSRY